MTAATTPRARTVFLGSGEFGVPVVAALAEHPNVDLAAIVTAPQRIGSRGKPVDPPVAKWAAEAAASTTVLRPERLRAPDSIAQIVALHPDLLVLADYGQIVPADLLEIPPHGALNLHPSLLPRHRGATPVPAAILEGDAETGVTLMRMDAGLDTGPIVAQWRTAIGSSISAPELEANLADQAARLLSVTLEHWLAGEIRPDPQAPDGATLTRPLHRSDGRLDPTKTADQLARQVRAYQPWPGSFIEAGGSRIVAWAAHPATDDQGNGQPATLVRTQAGGLGLRVADGTLILDDVQPAGGRRMTGAELLRGRPGFVGQSVA